eukprot:11769367-Alexandrium_andersonii.AAC.1
MTPTVISDWTTAVEQRDRNKKTDLFCQWLSNNGDMLAMEKQMEVARETKTLESDKDQPTPSVQRRKQYPAVAPWAPATPEGY